MSSEDWNPEVRSAAITALLSANLAGHVAKGLVVRLTHTSEAVRREALQYIGIHLTGTVDYTFSSPT